MFPGLEYLDNEPSSSEADLVGPAARRQVPDPLKLTQPYVALLADKQWISVTWEQKMRAVAFFDSPDRTFNSGAHVAGLLFPPFHYRTRTDGRWLPNETVRLKAGEELTARIMIRTGTGDSMQPAIEAYVRSHPFPEMPKATPSWEAYFEMAAGGWLDSKAREGTQFRHAVWPGFGPTRAADAAVYMQWLACQTKDANYRSRLTNLAAEVIQSVPRPQWAFAEVSHVRMPVAPLVFGGVAENQQTAREQAENLLRRFTPEGFVVYRAAVRTGGLCAHLSHEPR